MKEGNVNINEAKARHQALKRRFIPKILDIGAYALEIVQCPRILPGENNQEEADFEGENGETDRQQAARPAFWRSGRRLDRDRAFRKRTAWG